MRIEDILEAIHRIEQYTHAMDADAFFVDSKTLDAVVRNLIIIGEAARMLPLEVQQKYRKVPWAQMRAMRNIVVHEYFGVDETIIWTTVKDDLPPLVPLLEQILDASEER